MPSVLGESALGPLRGIPRDGDGDGQIHDGTHKEQAVPRSPVLPQHQPVNLRSFGDSAAIRGKIFDRVREAASTIPPITNQRHTMTLEDVGYEGATKYSVNDWKKAILGGRSLGTRLRGTWVLRDNDTGAVVDRKRSTVATVPYLTDHGTFIQNGSEYTLAHQLRLRPGVFTRVQANGELEAHVNVMPGKGMAHRIFMEPDTGVFRLKVGQSKMPLTGLLRAMGASDSQLRNAWGDLYQVNALKDDPSVIGKLHEKLVRKPDPNKTQDQEVREAFESMGLDPEVTKRTLGKPYDRVSLDQMLDTTKKLVAISHGQAEPDDRDHLAYMTAMGPEDLLSERVGKDRMLLGKTLWKASMTGSLKHVQPELLTKGINAAIMTSGLGQPTESINPSMLFDQQTRVSRLGVGGIPSLDAIPAEARNVQPSHFGLIDPLVTPESLHVGVDSRVTQATLKGDDGRLYSPFRNVKTGKMEHRSAQDLADSVIAFPGELNTLKPHVSALVGGKIRDVPRNQVQYELSSMDDAFSAISNLVPMKSTVKGQREVMAGRMMTQALPLKDPESPLVQAGVLGSNGDSYESRYGKQMGALRSDTGGVVEHVDKDKGLITVRGDDGKVRQHDLYINYPYNRKSVTGRTRIVVRLIDDHLWDGPISDYVHTDGNEILSIDPATKASAFMPITGFVSHVNDKRLYRVATASGRVVEVTEDHSLVTLGDDGSLVPVYPRDCIIRRTRLPVAMLPHRETAKIDVGRATLAGLYLAEGHLPEQAGLVCIAVDPDDRADAVLGLLRGIGLSPYRNGGNVCFTDHEVREWLDARFGRTSGGKHIRFDVLGWDVEALHGLVAGYFAGDGCLWADSNDAIQVTAVSTSERLRDGMLDVLASLGVFATRFDAPRAHINPEWNDAYGLRVISRHLAKLPRWFFYGDREVTFRELLKSKYRASPFELVPVPTKAARKTLYADFDEVPTYIYKTAHQGAVAKERIAAGTGPFGAWGRSDVMWDVIEAIEPIPHEEYVYDFCVKTSEVFAVCNGLIVHNTYIHQTPVVGPGDRIAPGALLARSNYTDDKGVTAIGQNARVAYVPFRGLNFEDAIVVSDSMAQRMSSEHMYQHSVDAEDDVKPGKKNHISIFPGKFDRAALETIDSDGVVKPGTIVTHDSPLILAVKQRERTHGAISRGRAASWSDHSEVWKHHAPGEVTDVEKTPNGIVVSVKSLNPMEVGDKMSGRYGDKGVVSSIIPDHEMPHDTQGRPFEVLLNPLGVITRCYDEKTEFLTPVGWKFGHEILSGDLLGCYDTDAGTISFLIQVGLMHAAAYQGPMLHYRNKVADFCVTPNHRMWTRINYAEWQEKRADEIFRKKDCMIPVATGKAMPGNDPGDFVLPSCERRSVKDTAWSDETIVIDAGDWAEFLGWYIAEGNTTWDEVNYEYRTHISQSDEVNEVERAAIASLLSRLPFAWNYNPKNIQFHISSKRLASYLCQFGLAHEKYIPAWLFRQTPATRQRFFDAYWLGDGSDRPNKSGSIVSQASTVSRRLADDLQRLGVMQGICLSIYPKTEKRKLNQRQGWTISKSEVTHRGLYRDKWEEVVYDGMIYCPTVPTGYVVTRRNGRILIAGNTNPAQKIEAALGKVAEKTGQPYRVVDFDNDRDYNEWAIQELARHGLSSAETIHDPVAGRDIPRILTGNRWFMKLHHTSESKSQGRGTGGYTAEGAPARGGEGGSKRISLMDINALLSSGATEVLRDAGAVRGQQHPEFWQQFMSGHAMPTPKTPMIYDKFINLLKAGGINVVRQGSRLNVMALSNNDINDLAGDREVTSGDTVDWKGGLKPIPGGLFDEKLTGGHGGNRWSYIKLAEPLPNPVMEEPIRRMLGLTKDKFMDVLAGKEQIGDSTGSAAIAKALDNIDVDQSLAQARADIRSGRKGARDAAVRKLGYLKMVKKTGVHPRDWMIDKAPVLPPMFRPVSTMAGSKLPMVADANYLYKELIDARDNLRDMTGTVNDLSNERLAAYQTLKGVTGLGDPIHPKNQERGVRGMLKQVFGNSPKTGMVQRKLLASATDLVGRATIVPNPDLDMDQVGLPETRAWDVYQPFIVRRLVRRGMNRMDAVRAVKERKPEAREAMVHEMDARPVILNRAPVHHRYGIMAFRPRLEKGDTLHVSPLIVTGFGADFDGDAMQYHVPATDEAVRDAYEKMLPSRNLLATSSFKAHQLPSREYAAGLYAASAMRTDRRPRVFATKADALAAYRRGEINVDHPVEIVDDR